FRARVESLQEREFPEAREVAREDQVAIDAEAAADPSQEEGGRAADGSVDGAEREERGEALAVDGRAGVAAVDAQAVDGESAQEHADVLDVLAAADLAQAPGQGDAG